MKSVKSLALAAAVLLGAQAMQAEFTYAPYSGLEPSVGVGIGTGGLGSFNIGVNAQLRVADWVRLSPEINYNCPDAGWSAVDVRLVGHMPISLNALANFDNPVVNIYPVGGLAYEHSTFSYDVNSDWGRASRGSTVTYETTYNSVGVVFGAGAELKLTDNIKVSLEERYFALSSKEYFHPSHWEWTAGVHFVF